MSTPNTTEKEKNSPMKLPDGTIIRFTTKKLGVSVYRQRFNARDGSHQYSRSFYLSKMLHGEVARFPLGLEKREAERLADEITHFLSLPTNSMAMAIAKYNPRVAVRGTHFANFGEILDLYEKGLAFIGRKGGSVSKSSFKGYKSFILRILREVDCLRQGKPIESYSGRSNIDFSRWLGMSTEILTDKFVTDFKTASLPGEEEDDEEIILSAKISANSALTNARALFGKTALRYYKSVGVVLPDLTGFLQEPGFRDAQKYFVLLPTEVIVRIMRDSLELRMSDPEAYRVFLLCIQCGMRAGEAAAFRPSWLDKKDKWQLQIRTKGVFNPKHGHGRTVIIEQWVVDTIQELRKGELFITESGAFDRLNAWIRTRIPEEHKVFTPTHSLRKLWFSNKSKVESIQAAAEQGGHKDVKITMKHYSSNLMPEWLAPFWEMPTAEAMKLPQFQKSA